MTTFRIQDNSKYCDITKVSFLDNLWSYDVLSNPLSIKYNNKSTTTVGINSKLNLLQTYINRSQPNNNDNIWFPIFINDDNYINTKPLSAHGAYSNGNYKLLSARIGIENFYQFRPEFKNWNTNGLMSVDWILNSFTCPYNIYYGILGWARNLLSSSNYVPGGKILDITKFSNSSRLMHNNVIYIKINDTKLWSISENREIDISTLGNNPQFNIANSYSELSRNTNTLQETKQIGLDIVGTKYQLWIPDGDFFSYYGGENEKIVSERAGLISKSYVSQPLYKFYSSIYRILTIDEKRSFNPNLNKLRRYKKLAHVLSTSPFINEISIYALDNISIKNLVQSYVHSKSLNIEKEQIDLQNIILDISSILQKSITNSKNTLCLDTENSFFTNNNNLIVHETQLFQKLMQKYGAELLINGRGSISPKNVTLDSNGIVVTQAARYYCDKRATDTTIASDQIISINDCIIRTNLSEIEANIQISAGSKTTTIPLADAARPKFYPGNDVANRSTMNLSLAEKGEVTEHNSEATYADYIYYANCRYGGRDADWYSWIFQSPNSNNVYSERLKTLFSSKHCPNLEKDGLRLKAFQIKPKIVSKNERGLINGLVSPIGEEDYLINLSPVFWKQIYGPPSKFKYESGFAGLPGDGVFLATHTGKYIFECTATTPFGTFKKQKTIYIVDGRQKIEVFDDTGFTIIVTDNPLYGKYWDPSLVSRDNILSGWVEPPVRAGIPSYEFDPIILNKDNVLPMLPRLNKFAISTIGKVFFPISTDLEVRENIDRSKGNSFTDQIRKLESDYVFKFASSLSDNKSNFSITFQGSSIIRLHSVFLERIRGPSDLSAQCLSLYVPRVKSRLIRVTTGGGNLDGPVNTTVSPFTIRTNKNPDSFELVRYVYDNQDSKHDSAATMGQDYVSFIYPTITTNNTVAPPVHSYGGYSRQFVDSLGVKIPGHPDAKPGRNTVPLSLLPNGKNNEVSVFPVSGFPLDYRNSTNSAQFKACYQKLHNQTPTTGSIITFEKGVLHPSSGWIPYSGDGYAIHANRCGVLKFNPGARDSFSFLGPKISSIESNIIDISNNTIKPTIYSSSITLGVAEGVRLDPLCSCKPTSEQFAAVLQGNKIHKEYADIDTNFSNHGFRILGGGKPKSYELKANRNSPIMNDEFLTDQEAGDQGVDGNFSYEFAVTGPYESGSPFRSLRVNDFGISDIEVKLNFLNYVNTKNLVVWLETTPGPGVGRFVEPPPNDDDNESPNRRKIAQSPNRSVSEKFLDQDYDPGIMDGDWSINSSLISNSIHNNGLENYLTNLTKLNSTSGIDDVRVLKLYLLNQETIQNNTYNLSLTFTDHANKNTVLYDHNVNNKNIDIYSISQVGSNQVYAQNNHNILPTMCANDYSDREACFYSQLIKNNKLTIANNTFSKFIGDSLFSHPAPTVGICPPDKANSQKGSSYIGKTTFTLKMMVLDEPDDMNLNDNGLYNHYYSGLETADNKIKSTINIANSLCSWELILHVGAVKKPLPNTSPSLFSYGNNDPLSLIKYGQDPIYPGYSFMADLSNYQHLLPLANMNAPYSCVGDSTICLTTQSDLTGQGVMVQSPEFPHWAILAIILSTAGYGLGTGGTLVGALAGLPTVINNQAYAAIINWFAEVAYTRAIEDAGRLIYFPNYAKYAFGSPEKMLINFRRSKNELWHTLEACIFKYHNTPILKPNRLNFIAVHRSGLVPNLNEFKFTNVGNYEELIDSKYIKNIQIPSNVPLADISTPTIINDIKIYPGDICDVSIISDNPSTIRCVFITGTPSKRVKIIDPDGSNLEYINLATSYLHNNIVLSPDNNIFDNSLVDNINNNQVILFNDRIPYDIFKVGDAVEVYNAGSDTASTEVRILKKGLIFKDNQHKSIIISDVAITGGDVISPKISSNTYVVYKNYNTIENEKYKRYSVWGLNDTKKQIFNLVPNIGPNTHSLGSYGDLSIFLNKNVLSQNIVVNNLESIEDIFNNKLSDRIKHNKIKFFDEHNDMVFEHTSNSYGFCYHDNRLITALYNLKNKDAVYLDSQDNLQTDTNNDTFIDELKNDELFSVTKPDTNIGNIAYIRLESNNILPISNGFIEIENNYEEYIPIRKLNTDEINKLTNRLSIIDDINEDNSLENKVGDPDQTTSIINSGKLFYLKKHYNLLQKDEAGCHVKEGTTTRPCYKKLTLQAMSELYTEKRDIIELLDSQTIKYANVKYSTSEGGSRTINGNIVFENEKSISIKPSRYALNNTFINKSDIISITRSYVPQNLPDLLPKISPKIDGTSKLSISYELVNTNHYWINIDPNQSTVLDFASNPKILLETEYACIPANANAISARQDKINHNVCPQFLFRSPARSKVEGVETIEYRTSTDGLGNTPASAYKYTLPTGQFIETEKRRLQTEYPTITGWKTFVKERYFAINGDKVAGDLFIANDETTIRSRETYLVPLSRVFGGSTMDMTADGIPVGGMQKCVDGNNNGSPGGFGLLDSFNTRVGKSTRVKNIVNLDNTDTIQVMIKRIPRMLRGADLLATIYKYGNKTVYRSSDVEQKIPFDLDTIVANGAINNGLYYWICMQLNGEQVEYTEIPPFFKLQNEMMFRSLFGSVDRMENKTSVLVSQFPWEMIPYEYAT